ncbi:hypothetical protein [Methylobacterium sp. JK268]
MRSLAWAAAAVAVFGTAQIGTAQAYEWGGGSCVGYGCVRALHDDDDGDRVVVRRRIIEERPSIRIEERRIERRPHDWDDDED